MSELPAGWSYVCLGQLLHSIEAGLNVKCEERAPEDDEVGLVKISAVTWGRFDEQQSKTLPLEMQPDERNRIHTGDLLISRANTIELVGACVIVGEIQRRLYLSDKVLRLRVHEPSKRWINYALKTPQIRKAIQSSSTGNQLSMRNIPQDKLRALEMPLAPEPEQQRIVNQLDALLARVQACNDRFDAIPALLKRFRQTVLTAASSGDLTSDWRDSNPAAAGAATQEVKLRLDARRKTHAAKTKSKFKEPVPPDLAHWRLDVPESWSVESVSAFAECLDHVRVPVTKDKRATAERLYPYFGANGQVDMVDDFLFDDELVMVTEDETFYGRVKPIAYRFSGRCWVNNHAHVLLAGDRVRADYLCFSIMHYDVQPWLTGTTGRAKLTQGALNALPIAVPPQDEMIEIVRRVNSMFALADRIEARCGAARPQAQRLTPLVLAKAFRGELVPQDPNDEPASALLARIWLPNAAATVPRKQMQIANKKPARRVTTA